MKYVKGAAMSGTNQVDFCIKIGVYCFCFQLLTKCLHMQVCSLKFYRTSHLTCSFVWPGWRSFVFAVRSRGNVLIKYMTRRCRTPACHSDGDGDGESTEIAVHTTRSCMMTFLTIFWTKCKIGLKTTQLLSFLFLLDPQQFTSFNPNPETAFSSLRDSYGLHVSMY